MRQKGFTLIEVVASLAILAIVLSYLLYIYEASADRALANHEKRLASLLCQNKLEEILVGQVTQEEGTFPNHPGFRWKVQKSRRTLYPKVVVEEVTVSVFYPASSKPYTLTVWRSLKP